MKVVAEFHIIASQDEVTGEMHVNVQGPVANKVLAYGVFERAKDAVRQFDPAKSNGLVVPQPGSRLAP